MLDNSTKKIIREHKWNKQSNPSQFKQRLRVQVKSALNDLTLIAKELPEEFLVDAYTRKPLQDFIRAILEPKSQRTRILNEMLAYEIWQKLDREMPSSLSNFMSQDIGKTWAITKLLKDYYDKPLSQ